MSQIKLFAELGMALFPVHAPVEGKCSCGKADCSSQAKHPRISDWQNLATNNLLNLRAWDRQFPGCNWGIATGMKSGVVVVDVDPRHAGDESLPHSSRSTANCRKTWEVITGSGGRHLYFRHPGTHPINNSAGLVGPGIDIRGDGGFVVGPGVNAHLRTRLFDIGRWSSRLCGARRSARLDSRQDRQAACGDRRYLHAAYAETCRRVALAGR